MTTKTLSDHAAVAKAIRAELKRRGVAGRVTSSSFAGGNSVDVYTFDLPPTVAKELEAFCGQFMYGHFDGMTDCYEYSNKRSDLPQAKYVHLSNRTSATLEASIWEYCRRYFHGLEQAPETGYENLYVKELDCYGSQLVWRVFNGSQGNFWNATEET